VLTDSADGVQVRIDTPSGEVPADTELTLLDNPVRPEDEVLAGSAPAASAQAAVNKPTIITRAQWGADESLRRGTTSYSDKVKVAFVHHVVSTNDYTRAQAAQQMRNVYSWFTEGIQVNDFGYNFMVDRFGRIYEGRAGGVDKAVIGAHTAGFNAETFAVSFLGNADTLNPDAASKEKILDAMSDLIAWKFDLDDVNPLGTDVLTSAGPGPGQGTTSMYWPGEKVTSKTIAGHGDIGSTSCPGVFLRPSLDHIRLAVSARQGRNFFPPSITGDRLAWGSGGNITLTPRSNGAMEATMTISNACGDPLRTLSASTDVAADVPFTWNLRDSAGKAVPPGLYTFEITASSNGKELFPWVGTARISATADSPPDPCTPPEQFTLSGTGYGHGVGLSQWGAYAMASQDPKRWTAKRIVEYYYQGETAGQSAKVEPVIDDKDVRIGLLYQAPEAKFRVENLGGTGAQMHITYGAKSYVFGPGVEITLTPSRAMVAVQRTDGGRTESLGRGRTITVRWSGTRDPGDAGTANALLNVVGPGETFSSTGHRYRYGNVDITGLKTSNGRRLAVVNTLRLGDEYLKGIAEVNPTWPDGALQAQAIASRSYALSQVARGLDADCGCHMDDGDGPKYDQTFRGWLAESQYGDPNRWAEAVDATRPNPTTGLVATYNGSPVNAYYTAATGGHTLAASDVWGGASVPWARGVPDTWSLQAPGNPYRSWTVVLSQQRVAEIFGMSDIMKLVLNKDPATGAAKGVKARALDGRTATLSAQKLRQAIGYTSMKSTFVSSITDQDVSGPIPVPKGGVTLVANPAGNVPDNTIVTLSGIIKKPRPGLLVQRQVKVNNGAWLDRQVATPDAEGKFAFAVPVGGRGTTYSWRVVVMDGGTPVASSPTRVATVL
jgi:SpoIID/LytB domain protein